MDDDVRRAMSFGAGVLVKEVASPDVDLGGISVG